MSEVRWERRSWMGEPVELREGPNGRPVLVGFAIRYDRMSKNLGGFVEHAMPGSVTKTIREQDIVSLFNHQPDNLLGRLGAGTLRLVDEPQVGLRYEVDPPDTSMGRDVVELARRGDIPGSSFGFMVAGRNGSVWTRSSSGFPVRELHVIKLRDLGPVTFPAYSGTEVALRSLAEERALPLDEVAQAAGEGRLAELLGATITSEEASETGPRDTHRVFRRVYV